MTEFEFITYEREPGDIGIFTVNRSKVLNALRWQTLRELTTFLENIFPKENLKALIVTGAGDKPFVSGADIVELSQMEAREFQHYIDLAHKAYELIESDPGPCIAAINGYALGELALACDIRVASERAKLGFPKVKLGIFPGWGRTQRLTRILGLGRTKELVFTGDDKCGRSIKNWTCRKSKVKMVELREITDKTWDRSKVRVKFSVRK